MVIHRADSPDRVTDNHSRYWNGEWRPLWLANASVVEQSTGSKYVCSLTTAQQADTRLQNTGLNSYGPSGSKQKVGADYLSGTKDTKIHFQPWEWNPNDSKPEYQTEIMGQERIQKLIPKRNFSKLYILLWVSKYHVSSCLRPRRTSTGTRPGHYTDSHGHHCR